MNQYGYVRVSSQDQSEARQLVAMKAFGLHRSSIYVEKMSGIDFDRPIYKNIVHKLKKGDLFVIKSIDRLGRNYHEIIEQWALITKKCCASIVVLDMPLLDTRNDGRDLTNTLIADLVLQILSYVAEIERTNIHQRQMEGISAAKERGIVFGRPNKKVPEQFPEVFTKWQNKSITLQDAAYLLNTSPNTFRRWCQNKNLNE